METMMIHRHIFIDFNPDGTKMFLRRHYQNGTFEDRDNLLAEFNLSTPFDISTRTYAGDSERCNLDEYSKRQLWPHTDNKDTFDLEF